MVGVVDRGGERLALLRVDGALQAVRQGQRVGVHGGTVQMISDRSVTVSEPVRDALGRSTRRTSVLTLKEAKP
jgi:type IV pilus assembly protein PilP